MKKNILVLTVLICISLIGILFFNKKEEQRIPEEGIYFINQNSFYSFIRDEEIMVYLDFFYVTSQKQSADIFEKCTNFSLLNGNGKEYKLNFDKENIIIEQNEIKINKKRIIQKYQFAVTLIDGENTVIKTLKYKNSEGTIEKYDLGRIEIEILDDKENRLEACSNRVDWVSMVQPTFSYVEWIFKNLGKEEISVCDVSYGESGIILDSKCNILLSKQQEKEYRSDIVIENEEEGEPIIYYLKPKVTYIYDQLVYVSSFTNVSKEAYYGTEEQLIEYLYNNCQNKGSKR